MTKWIELNTADSILVRVTRRELAAAQVLLWELTNMTATDTEAADVPHCFDIGGEAGGA